MKISRSNFIEIATSLYKTEVPEKKVDYNKWVEFIETHKEYFIWYEDTGDGKEQLQNIENLSEFLRDRILHSLNRIRVYSTNLLVKNPSDFIVTYRSESGTISISIEKKMSKEMADILLKMAEYVGGKLIINGTKELENVEQLD